MHGKITFCRMRLPVRQMCARIKLSEQNKRMDNNYGVIINDIHFVEHLTPFQGQDAIPGTLKVSSVHSSATRVTQETEKEAVVWVCCSINVLPYISKIHGLRSQARHPVISALTAISLKVSSQRQSIMMCSPAKNMSLSAFIQPATFFFPRHCFC